jgi:uncharacterized protein (DUF58 family)
MDLKALFSRLEKIEISTRNVTKQVASGQYHSAFKGRGMSFAEVRDYSAGDDVRSIDWNVTARFDSPYVKVFEEERELVVMLLIDVSQSMRFGLGDKNKATVALEVAATTIFSALANHDRVGAIFFSDQVERVFKPGKGRKHGLLILKELVYFESKSNRSSLKEVLHFFRSLMKKQSLAVLISDFQIQEDYQKALKITRSHHDLVALHVENTANPVVPNLGFVETQDLESNGRSWFWFGSKQVRKDLEQEQRNQMKTVAEQVKKAHVDYCLITTDQPFVRDLVLFFHKRMKK